MGGKPVWLFMLYEASESYWRWTRVDGTAVVRGEKPAPTFWDCIEDAKAHGFDFSKTYHVLTP
jgi:hypothetical protein